MTPAEQPNPTDIGLVRLYQQSARRRFEVTEATTALDEIAARWAGIDGWAAPLRNPLWVESEGGTPVAAVSGNFSELIDGEIEHRRQAIAHAPSDIHTLLQVIQSLQSRPRAQRRPRSEASQPPITHSAAA